MPPKATQNKAKYFEGEKILCFHGPLLYEAKCLQVEQRDGQTKYFVHYQGWNKNWDEWVTDARMMKFNAVGLQKQKELKDFYSKPGRKVKGLRKSELRNQEYPPPEALRKLEEKSAAKAEEPAPRKAAAAAEEAPPRRVGRPPSVQSQSAQSQSAEKAPKRERETSVSTDAGGAEAAPQSAAKRLRVHIEMPRLLKLCLADDCDCVTGQRQLLALPPPAGQTVAAILARFVGQAPEAEREAVAEFAAGVQCYFNSALGTQLLYGFERPQRDSLLRAHRAAAPASLYGCVHLLRLMLRLGDLLQHTRPDVKCLSTLLDHCDSLLTFIEKNLDSYVSPAHYEASTAEYQKLAP